jgi:HSP20 family protein
MHFLTTRRGFPGLDALHCRMNRLMRDFSGGSVATWGPALDVSETEDALEIQAELPGVDPENIEITVSGDELVIRGEKTARVEESERSWHRVERRHGSFERTLRLPESVDADSIEATSSHGVLILKLPKREEVQPRRIEIRGEK